MRSSTSSSDVASAGVSAPAATPARTPLLDRRVWIGLLVIFAALEIFTRTWLFSVSKDFRRFRAYPARARALIEAQGALRVALIGNSATDRGVDARIVEGALAAGGRPARADLFVADQSRIDTWRFVFERFFAAPGLRPDLVVVTFYENDLEDGNPVEIGRLAQFFTTVRDWPEVMSVNLHGLDDRASFAISSFWATFAASDRVRERLLAALVPDFRAHSERVNGVIFEHEHRRDRPAALDGAPGAVAARAPTFVALRHLLDRAAASGVGLCFVAYPTLIENGRAPYELSPGLPEVLHGAGAGFVDLRGLPILRPEHYADEVHLTEEGRAIYSRAFGSALAHAIAGGVPGRTTSFTR
jgi:hypothetical protein